MLGKTNACVGSSGGGASGASIEAINKTSSVINEGDKVWLNKNQQTAGSSYQIGANGSDVYRGALITRSGMRGWRYPNLYSIGTEAATYLGNLPEYDYSIKYGKDGSVFIGSTYTSHRIDEKAQFSIDAYYIKDDYFINSVTECLKIDLADGSVKESFGRMPSFFGYNRTFMLNDVFYGVFNNSAMKAIYNGESWESTDITYITPYGETFYPIDVTLDNKYVIGATSYKFSNDYQEPYLRIVEIVDENTLKELTQAEMPEDLQEFYNTVSNITFNPYTGILTVVGYGTNSYVVMKYENGTWTKLPINLGVPEGALLMGAITVSDDLTRACYGTNEQTATWRIVNLTTIDGYAAVPYKFYNINENSITAIAKTSAELDATFEATVGGNVTEVNNQDLYITDNGVYTAGEGFTGLGTVDVNVPKGKQITAINKTGTTITAGQKVWLKPNGDSYEVESFETDYENFVNVGGVTINDKTATGFSTAQYLQAQSFNPENNPWELVLKFKYNQDYTPSSTAPYYFWTKPSNERYGLSLGTYISPEDSKIRLWLNLSTNGTSWENWNGWNEDWAGWNDFAFSVDTVYWVKLSWNGTEYKVEYSTDGETFNLGSTYASSSPIHYPLTETIVGHYLNSYPASGMTIYLDGCYGKINGNKVWSLYHNAVNEDWITGYATTNGEPDGEVIVSTPVEVSK